MSARILYNRTTNHIDGLDIRSAGSEFDYAENACGALTRGRTRMARGKEFDTATEALAAARVSPRKLCKTCESAALAQG